MYDTDISSSLQRQYSLSKPSVEMCEGSAGRTCPLPGLLQPLVESVCVLCELLA